jgi:hypothetical protein
VKFSTIFYYSELDYLLANDYLFLFSTLLDIDKDSDSYGHVHIDLIRQDQLSYFNHHLRDKADYFILEDESIVINQFLEIIPKNTNQGIQVYANLHEQKTIYGTNILSHKILLIKTNEKRFFNLPIYELGPEFQAKVEHDKAKENYGKLLECNSMLTELYNSHKENSLESSFETVSYSLDKEIEYAEMESVRTFNRYLEFKRRHDSIHKR